MADHSLVFYRVRVEPMVINLDNVRRVHGMEQLLGPAAALASVLGDDPDIATPIEEVRADGLLCLTCYTTGYSVAQLAEDAND
jgi:hypothetical protein